MYHRHVFTSENCGTSWLGNRWCFWTRKWRLQFNKTWVIFLINWATNSFPRNTLFPCRYQWEMYFFQARSMNKVTQFWRKQYKIKFTPKKLYHRPWSTRFLRNPCAEETSVLAWLHHYALTLWSLRSRCIVTRDCTILMTTVLGVESPADDLI